MSKLKVLDLFSGIGGFSLGLDRTGGFETVAFCEVDKACTKVLNKHWPNVPVFDDVKTLKGTDLNGKIDVICGGFPCQDISLAGKGAGLDGERSGLWFEFHRLIKEIKPSYVIAENVPALRSRGLDKVLGSLAEIGYDAEWHCIPASAIGAKHKRDRIWVVAYPNVYSDIRTQPRSNGEKEKLESFIRSQYGSTGEFSGTSERIGRDTLRGHVETYNLANTDSKGLQGSSQTGYTSSLRKNLEQFITRCRQSAGTWSVEPNVGRVADGVPNRSHRIKQLGNAVVPQIPELIGRAILNEPQ